MPEVIAAIVTAILCVISFMFGKSVEEKEELENEIEKIHKGTVAGDNAVDAFRMRHKK